MKSTKRLVGKKKRMDGTRQERLSAEQVADKLARGKKAIGRPGYIYGGDIYEEILSRLANGESLTSICRDEHLPSRSVFLRKTRQDKDLALAYARARLDGADMSFDEILDEIREKGLNESQVELGRLRLLIDTKKWVLSHLNPRKYSDKADFNPDEGKKPSRIIITGPKNETREPGESD